MISKIFVILRILPFIYLFMVFINDVVMTVSQLKEDEKPYSQMVLLMVFWFSVFYDYLARIYTLWFSN